MVIQPISTRLIKPTFCFDLSHRGSTIVSLETRKPFILHITDPLRKFTWLHPLLSKETEEVINILEKQFHQFGFPSILHSENGKEFKSKKMLEFCKEHKIKQVHGAPRSPTT